MNDIVGWAKDETLCRIHREPSDTLIVNKKNENCEVGGGDILLFHGLLSHMLSPGIWGRAIHDSMDSQGGMWRSPQKVNNDYYRNGKKRMSFDSILGFLLYLVEQKKYGNVDYARTMGNRWSNWLEAHGRNYFNLCSGDRDYCSLEDQIVDVYYTNRGAFVRLVLSYIGAEIPSRSLPTYRLGDRGNANLVLTGFLNGCRGTPKVGEKYLCHLYAVSALILLRMGYPVNFENIPAGFSDNPFTLYVLNGAKVNQKIADLTFEKSTQAHEAKISGINKKIQWAWERSKFDIRNDGDLKIKPWQDSFGWDCVGMLNLVNKWVGGANSSSFFDGDFGIDADAHQISTMKKDIGL